MEARLLVYAEAVPAGSWDWAELGPGAKKGIELIFAKKNPNAAEQLELTRYLVNNMAEAMQRIQSRNGKGNGKGNGKNDGKGDGKDNGTPSKADSTDSTDSAVRTPVYPRFREQAMTLKSVEVRYLFKSSAESAVVLRRRSPTHHLLPTTYYPPRTNHRLLPPTHTPPYTHHHAPSMLFVSTPSMTACGRARRYEDIVRAAGTARFKLQTRHAWCATNGSTSPSFRIRIRIRTIIQNRTIVAPRT